MKTRRFHKNFWVILVMDVLLLAGVWYASYLIRFDFEIPKKSLISFKKVLPFMILVKVISFYFFDLYRGMWRYTSIADLLNIIKATTVSSLLLISFVLFMTRFIRFSRSIFIIDWFLIFCNTD